MTAFLLTAEIRTDSYLNDPFLEGGMLLVPVGILADSFVTSDLHYDITDTTCSIFADSSVAANLQEAFASQSALIADSLIVASLTEGFPLAATASLLASSSVAASLTEGFPDAVTASLLATSLVTASLTIPPRVRAAAPPPPVPSSSLGLPLRQVPPAALTSSSSIPKRVRGA